MKKLSHEDILKIKPSKEDVLKKKRSPIIVVLDNIRSLYNVGSIFRTSDAILAEKIYLCGITGTPPRNEISKTALGAQDVVPWEYEKDVVKTIKKLKRKKIKIFAVELAHKAKKYDKIVTDFPVALILGHEVNGVKDEVMELVDGCVFVPMLGRANSLNVATCFGIVAYEFLKKFNNKRKK